MTELFADKFKNKILSQKRGLIGIAQINPIAGNIEYNAKKVVKYINLAQSIESDLVVFPELTLMGYPIEDTIDRYPIIVEDNIKWLKEIAKITTKTCAIIGFVEPREDINVGKKYYNSLAVIQNGIKSIVRKSLLPTYCEFNDYRYFEPSPVVGCQSADTLCNFDESKIENCPKTIIINGIKYGISICEDCWNNKEFFNDNILYSKDPIQELSEEEPDIFINCSASTTRAKKEQLKYNMLSFISKKYKTPLVYVNQVGAIDNNSFDGSSKVFDSDGLTNGPEKTLAEVKEYTLEYEPDLERTYKTILQGIRDYFNKTGFKKAVIGLSGGLDSSVCTVLLADALGKDNVLGISMPSVITSSESKNDAQNLAQNLGINFLEAPIKNVVDNIDKTLKEIFKKVETKWNNRFEDSFTMDNIQARSRAIFLWGISNEFSKTLPIATSDKSELYMGYASLMFRKQNCSLLQNG